MQVKNKVENVLKRKPGIFSDRLGKCRDEVENVKGYIVTSQWRTTGEFMQRFLVPSLKNHYGLVRLKYVNNLCMIQEKVKYM